MGSGDKGAQARSQPSLAAALPTPAFRCCARSLERRCRGFPCPWMPRSPVRDLCSPRSNPAIADVLSPCAYWSAAPPLAAFQRLARSIEQSRSGSVRFGWAPEVAVFTPLGPTGTPLGGTVPCPVPSVPCPVPASLFRIFSRRSQFVHSSSDSSSHFCVGFSQIRGIYLSILVTN